MTLPPQEGGGRSGRSGTFPGGLGGRIRVREPGGRSWTSLRMHLSFKYFLCFLFFPPITLLSGMGKRGRRSPIMTRRLDSAVAWMCASRGVEKDYVCSGIRNKRPHTRSCPLGERTPHSPLAVGGRLARLYLSCSQALYWASTW